MAFTDFQYDVSFLKKHLQLSFFERVTRAMEGQPYDFYGSYVSSVITRLNLGGKKALKEKNTGPYLKNER